MNPQPNRLPPETVHRLRGTEIDRAAPVHFRLNGRQISGFAGDTVLSAALASGILAAGQHAESPLALDERFAPHVIANSRDRDPGQALPMQRTPAIDGLDLETLGLREHGSVRDRVLGGLGQWSSRNQPTLGLHFDTGRELSGPWIDMVPEQTLRADLVVVGGGIAGLSAAVAAGQKGNTVILVERRPVVGGDIRFFGSLEGEEPPEVIVKGLLARLTLLPNVTILTAAEAFAVYDRTVRVHQVQRDAPALRGRVIALQSQRIVLATGTVERLPLFPGNRLPGVIGAIAAFQLADRYAIWPGRTALIATSASEPYRLAMLAKDAGIAVQRVVDSRLRPQSRFVEFSKAYGIPLAPGLLPAEASLATGKDKGVLASFSVAVQDTAGAPEPIRTDRLIISGGWQPDLTLWFLAGGASSWQAQSARLVAEGSVDGVLLAGSAAGYGTNWACMRSGHAAAARLFGRTPPRAEDRPIDPIYETPPGTTSVAPWSDRPAAPTYLDFGTSLTRRTPDVQPRARRWPLLRHRQRWPLADQSRALSIGDVAAGVQIGAIPASDAAVVAQERGVVGGNLVRPAGTQAVAEPKPAASTLPYPQFLFGRFGDTPVIQPIAAQDGRTLEAGCLIYASSSDADPARAIGVVLRPGNPGGRGTLALLSTEAGRLGQGVWVRDLSQMVSARLLAPDAQG